MRLSSLLNFFQKSLRNKLLLLFSAIGFLPFITLLIYTIYLGETKILNRVVVEQSQRTDAVVKLLNNHLVQMKKELGFLSSLDLMDDLLAEDIDRRVSRVLSQKKDDLNLELNFIVVNMKSQVVAASDRRELLQKYNSTKLKGTKGSYVELKTLFIYSKIFASFDRKKTLAYLVLEYKLENLDLYLTHQESIHSYIINQKNGQSVGEDLSLNLSFTKGEESLVNAEHIMVYKRLLEPLSEWYVVYAVDKSVALKFLYELIQVTLYLSIVIFLFIIYASIYYSRGVVKPIEKLTKITDDISKNQNYNTRIYINSKDEISTLTSSFNEMLNATSTALSKLEKENKLRLKRFTQLIEVFNAIIQTKTEEECVSLSIKEISKLTNMNNLYFIQNRGELIKGEFSELYVSDFENDKKVYFGAISLGIEKFEDINEKNFYNSIASMVSLQLDRIRLIRSTLLASNAKSAFISSMSHELRTPLNAIIGSAQYMISYEKLSDEQLDTVANIESSSHYLLGMINDILDIAKIEAGKVETHFQLLNIQEIVQNSYNMLYPLALDKELEFIYTSTEPIKHITDAKLLQQIIVNLLSNAIKFTEVGKIVLELKETKESVVINIKDSGIGISNEGIKTLFKEFSQIENVMQKSQKGTGLGLSISRKMAKLIDGEIELFSTGLGEGSEAILTLYKTKGILKT